MSNYIQPLANQNQFTMFNNFILDTVMPDIKPTSWKVLCFIIRKTVGWHKESDNISFSQIKAGTGISSTHTIIAAIEELKDYHLGPLVIKKENKAIGNSYQLNTALKVAGAKNAQQESLGSAKNALGGSAKNAPQVVQKMHIQKKVLNKDIKEKRETPSQELPDKSLMIEFTPVVQSLLRCNPGESGCNILNDQIKQVSELSQWLIMEMHATIKQVKAAIIHFSWMTNAPTIKQIKAGWSAICTELKNPRKKQIKLTNSQSSRIAPGQAEIWEGSF